MSPIIEAPFTPLTRVEFEEMKSGVHAVGKWTGDRRFNQSPCLDRHVLLPVDQQLMSHPINWAGKS